MTLDIRNSALSGTIFCYCTMAVPPTCKHQKSQCATDLKIKRDNTKPFFPTSKDTITHPNDLGETAMMAA